MGHAEGELPLVRSIRVGFANGRTAPAVRVRDRGDLGAAFRALQLERPRPTLVLVGGAGGLDDAELARLRPLLTTVLVPLAERGGLSIVDGGTDSGVMRLLGQARAEAGATFPLIGVAASDTVTLPAEAAIPHAAPLEPHHTHFILVPGSAWGDEAPWLAGVASALADGVSSMTLLVNGGDIAWQDVSESVAAGRPVLVIAGSGRTADTLADALRREATDERAAELAKTGLLHAADLGADSAVLSRAIEGLLFAPRTS